MVILVREAVYIYIYIKLFFYIKGLKLFSYKIINPIRKVTLKMNQTK
jgi:hypothetical protein